MQDSAREDSVPGDGARKDGAREDARQGRLRAGVGLTLLVNGLLAAWVLAKPVLHHVPARAFLDVDYVLQTLGGVLAALFCFLPLGAGRPRRLPALLCGLGIGGYAAGQTYLTVYLLTHGRELSVSSPAELFDLLAYPLLLAGLLGLPARPLPLAARLRVSLDGLMTLTAAITFSWRFLLGPTVLEAHASLRSRIVNVSYPVGDLVLLLCLLLVAARCIRPETRRAVGWLGFGLLVVVATDTLETYVALHGASLSGTLQDVGWSLGYMPMGLAVAVLCRQEPDGEPDAPDRPPPLWLSLLPYALLPAVGLLAVWAWRTAPASPLNGGVWAGALALVGLVLARQVLSLVEGRRLYGSLRLAHAGLASGEARYRQMFEANPHPMWVYAVETLQILAVNEAAVQSYGYDRAEFLTMTILSVRPPEEHDALRARLANIHAQPLLRHERTSRHRTGDGRLLDVLVTSTALEFDGIPARMVLAQDVTERLRLESERERLLLEAVDRADRDPLSGLWNHRAFHRRLEEEADRAQRDGTSLAVVMLDLDNFKFFNDAYGHLAGDGVLRQVAEALRRACRSYDTLARFGGDEFALLLPLPDRAADGHQAAAEISARLSADLGGLTFLPPGHDSAVPLTLSFGVALFPQEASSRADLVPLADERLFRAKIGGADDDEAERLRRHLLSSVDGYAMLDALLVAVDNKDRYTRRHSEDVLTYSLEIARALGLPPQAQTTTAVAALLHDVGKIGVPDRILRKPGRLTDAEYEAVQKHPMMGAIIVGAVPGFEDTLDAIRHHHERWDGGGYPFGLRGEETPLLARLMAVADAYSAMTTDRPYRKGMEPGKALRILEEGAGTQWDPACVRAFLASRQGKAASTLSV